MGLRGLPSLTLLFPESFRPYLVLAAAVLIHLTLGTLYCIGNLVPYMASYLRFVKHQDVVIGQMSWFGALTSASNGTFMFVGGLIENRLGSRRTIAIGCCLVVFGVSMTSLSLESGVAAAYVSYGVVFGAGIGIAYAPCIGCAMRWLPRRRGLVSGCVVAGFGMGAFIFNYVATWYVNPENLTPTIDIGGVEYFEQEPVLKQTPRVFLVLAACYAIMQVIGLSIITDPPIGYRELEEDLLDSGEQEKAIPGMTPREMLRTQTFYSIWFTYLLISCAVIFPATYYKIFGETFIFDDHFLSLTGSIASVLNSSGRIFWGYIGDRFSYQLAMTFITSGLAFLFFTMQICVRGGRVMYFVWILATYFTFSGIFALFPMVTANVFGRRYFTTNYGIVCTSTVISSLLSASIATFLLSYLHFYGMFLIIGCLACIALVLTMTVHRTDHGKRHAPLTEIND